MRNNAIYRLNGTYLLSECLKLWNLLIINAKKFQLFLITVTPFKERQMHSKNLKLADDS